MHWPSAVHRGALQAEFQQTGDERIALAGYMGQIILPLYYSTNYADQFTTGAIYYLNQVIAQVAAATGAQTADVFGAWYMASYAAGGGSTYINLQVQFHGYRIFNSGTP